MGLAHSGVQYRFTANSNISAGNVVMLQTSGINANVVPIGLYTETATFPDSTHNNLNNTSFGGNSVGSDGILDIAQLSNGISYANQKRGMTTFIAYNDYDGSGNVIGGKLSSHGKVSGESVGNNAVTPLVTKALTGTDAGDKFYNVYIISGNGNGIDSNYSTHEIYYTKYDASTSTASNHLRIFSIDPTVGNISVSNEVDLTTLGLPTTENSWSMTFLGNQFNNKYLFYYADPANNNYGTLLQANVTSANQEGQMANGYENSDNNNHPAQYEANTYVWAKGNAHVINSHDVSNSLQHKTFKWNPYGATTSSAKFLSCSSTHLTAGVINLDSDTVTVGTATTPTNNASHNVSMLSADWDSDYTNNKILAVYDTGANNGNNYVSARVGYYHSGNNQVTFSNTTQFASTTQGGSSGSSNITCLTSRFEGGLDGNDVQIDNGVTNGQFFSVKQHKSSGTENLIYMMIDVASNNSISFSETDTGVQTHSFAYNSGLSGFYYVSASEYDSGANHQVLTVNYSNPGLDIRKGNAKVRWSNIDSDNIIGVAPETVSIGDDVTIDLPMSVSSAYSGLTIGSQYYVDGTGNVSATVSGTNINSNHYIGKALGTDAIFLNGDIFGKSNTLDTVRTPD